MNSRTIEVTIEVEVFYREVACTYGEDEDGNRGIDTVERIPTTCQVLTRVPAAVEEWAKMQALDLFDERFN